jgi:rRNA maturation protein Nop10
MSELTDKDPYEFARKALDGSCKHIVKQCENAVMRAMVLSGLPCDPSYEDVAKEIVRALDNMKEERGNKGEEEIYREWEKTLKRYCPYCGGVLTDGGRINLSRVKQTIEKDNEVECKLEINTDALQICPNCGKKTLVLYPARGNQPSKLFCLGCGGYWVGRENEN